MCEYAATKPSNLKRPRESMHEGIKYPCDLCGHLVTTTSNSKLHKKVKHGNETTLWYAQHKMIVKSRIYHIEIWIICKIECQEFHM